MVMTDEAAADRKYDPIVLYFSRGRERLALRLRPWVGIREKKVRQTKLQPNPQRLIRSRLDRLQVLLRQEEEEELKR